MEHIVDEETLNALISILVVLCPYFERIREDNQDKNIVFDEFLNENKDTFYKEKILHLTNRGALYRLDKCMQTVNILLTRPESKFFFNENDLDFLAEVCIRELSS
mmetsp:Transcript_36018/g.26272  ORF Transcript_36018/g.26272 Transcript_36018/m.26272 type:complete len:105 (+) Transcript_36018:425-739(+)